MSTINLSAHQAALKNAWEEVLDDSRETNWALFGYEGQTYNLQLISKGSGGLEELQDEFQAAAIMYAFCRVTVPGAGVKRNVLINWQGESAPVVRKGCCANHLSEVERFFAGHQLTINARSEDDVEPEAIIANIEKCCAAVTISRITEFGSCCNSDPVGSVYQRVQPSKDVSISERERFWQQQQEEERRREIEEKKSMEEKRRREKEDEQRREAEAAKAREQRYREELKATNSAFKGKRNPIAPVKKLDTSMWEKQIRESEKNGKPAIPQPMKNFDRKSSISEARAIFEGRKKPENSLPDVVPSPIKITSKDSVASGKMPSASELELAQARFTSKVGNATSSQTAGVNESTTDSAAQKSATSDHITVDQKPRNDAENTTETAYQINDTKTPTARQFSYTRNLLTDVRRESIDVGNGHEDEDQDWEEEPLEEPPTKIPDPLVDAMVEQGLLNPVPPADTQNRLSANTVDLTALTTSFGQASCVADNVAPSHEMNVASSASVVDRGQCARALYDYTAADDTEISFDPDDIITNVDRIDEGWWQGFGPDGTFGLFPANYVELI